jgi:DnaJ-class molecular chaperone
VNAQERTRILDWDARIDSLSYEQVLGLSHDASIEDCRNAYYQFAQCFHPDVHPMADGPLREALCRIFQRGSEAYRVLTHPSLRVRWVRVRNKGALRLGDLGPSPVVDLHNDLPNLHVRCRSGGAKLEARQAAKSFEQGDVAGTKHHLERALAYEGGASPELARCLEALGDFGAGG